MHYPGQFIRVIDRPIKEIDIERYWIAEKISQVISDVITLRRRNKPSDPCNDENVDDSIRFRTMIVKNLKCIPGYWSNLPIRESNEEHSFPLCSTSQELNKAYQYIQNISSIISKDPLPCNEMAISSTIQNKMLADSEIPGRIHIFIRYATLQYQQIINVRDFDFDSMFSAIGGFVGIFLGCSLLQATEIIEMTLLRSWRCCRIIPFSSLRCLLAVLLKKGNDYCNIINFQIK